MPTHYGFILDSNLDAIEAEFKRLLKVDPAKLKPETTKPNYRMSESLATKARAVIQGIDKRGAWVEDGRLRYYGADDSTRRIISCHTFVSNVEILSQFLAASKSIKQSP